MTLVGVGAPTNGGLTILQNGQITFTANEGFVGRASFEFTVQDPTAAKATGVVRFIVLPPLPTDPLFAVQWHHANIRSVAVWDSGTATLTSFWTISEGHLGSLPPTPHTPCAVLYLVAMLIGC